MIFLFNSVIFRFPDHFQGGFSHINSACLKIELSITWVHICAKKCCLVVEPTHLKNIFQNGNLPQIGMMNIFKKNETTTEKKIK